MHGKFVHGTVNVKSEFILYLLPHRWSKTSLHSYQQSQFLAFFPPIFKEDIHLFRICRDAPMSHVVSGHSVLCLMGPQIGSLNCA